MLIIFLISLLAERVHLVFLFIDFRNNSLQNLKVVAVVVMRS